MPSINLISTLPNFTSQDEHTTLVGSTPNSFTDIPPVIRHKEEGVSVFLEPQLAGFSNEDAAQGTLYILTSVLVFMSTTGVGFQIEYPAITLHAVSRGESGPSIYCQLDESFGQVNGSPPANEDEDTEMRELTIVPKSSDSLEPIFEALSQCASLHPDPHGEEDDLDDAFVDINGAAFDTFTGDENEELSEVGRAAFAHLNSIIDDPHNLLPQSDGEDAPDHPESTQNAT
ncbi:hypothetical protein BYT27DRAFT_7235414 [Phlegmacium glaucopus]|nr:hypothetical protein BYT27DRAFT_7235414 [Phlegmacium glaucopus]